MTEFGTSLGWLRAPIVDPKTGMATPAFRRAMAELLGQRVERALNEEARLKDSLRLNPCDAAYTVKSGLTLAQVGVTTEISLSNGILQFGETEVFIGGATVDPGSFGLWIICVDNPKFESGVFPLLAFASLHEALLQKGRMYLGSLTTAGGGGGSGGGTQPPPAGGGGI